LASADREKEPTKSLTEAAALKSNNKEETSPESGSNEPGGTGCIGYYVHTLLKNVYVTSENCDLSSKAVDKPETRTRLKDY
jgi:hypothetical protein